MIIVVFYLLIITILSIIYKVNIFESFSKGIKSSFSSVVNLFPSIIFFVICVNVLMNSGLLEILKAFCERSKIIPEIFIQLILRPLSNSSSIIMMTKVYEEYGPNSFLGNLSTLIQVASDTTVYIVLIYFSSIGIKKIGKPLFIGILVNIITFIIAFILCYIFYKIL